MAKTHEMDLCEGSLWKKILIFSIPLMFSNILQVLFNMSDVAVVGKFAGPIALGAVGSTSILVTLFTGLLIGLASGVNALTALYIGSKSEKDVRETVHTAAILCLSAGVLICVLGILFTRPVLTLMHTKEELIDGAVLYLRLYLLGMPALAVFNFGNAVLSAIGDTKKPLIYLSIAGALNILLNLFFVIVCKIDVAGVAIATVISQVISVFLVMRCLLRFDGAAKISFRQIRLYRSEAVQMMQIGLPAGLQSMLFNISNVMVQSAVNSFGADVVAANTASGNIGNFTYTAQNSVYHAAITFTSQNLGARRYDRIDRIFWGSCAAVCIIGVPLSLLSTVFGPQLLSIYVSADDPARDAVIAMGMIRTYYVTTPYFLCGIMEVCCGMVRGLGKSWLPMFVTGIGACLSRIIWIYTIFQVHHTPEVLYSSYPMSWILTLSMHAVCFFVIYRRYERKLAGNTPAAT